MRECGLKPKLHTNQDREARSLLMRECGLKLICEYARIKEKRHSLCGSVD